MARKIETCTVCDFCVLIDYDPLVISTDLLLRSLFIILMAHGIGDILVIVVSNIGKKLIRPKRIHVCGYWLIAPTMRPRRACLQPKKSWPPYVKYMISCVAHLNKDAKGA